MLYCTIIIIESIFDGAIAFENKSQVDSLNIKNNIIEDKTSIQLKTIDEYRLDINKIKEFMERYYTIFTEYQQYSSGFLTQLRQASYKTRQILYLL